MRHGGDMEGKPGAGACSQGGMLGSFSITACLVVLPNVGASLLRMGVGYGEPAVAASQLLVRVCSSGMHFEAKPLVLIPVRIFGTRCMGM